VFGFASDKQEACQQPITLPSLTLAL